MEFPSTSFQKAETEYGSLCKIMLRKNKSMEFLMRSLTWRSPDSALMCRSAQVQTFSILSDK
jgi:hypothetical protein